ncbi:MAG: hypothetical protein HC852_15670 [Acaryochloridaceae cyanobacterium RU_4_10]|nr:hypothetical protein [Acaryochloridaceae cyanobacterium RU_4_10]
MTHKVTLPYAEQCARCKKRVAVQFCQHALDYIQQQDGKPWRYVLIAHDTIAENMALDGLVKLFSA